ncbi:unnamed protein product, partial [Amoebophrya sp. A25]
EKVAQAASKSTSRSEKEIEQSPPVPEVPGGERSEQQTDATGTGDLYPKTAYPSFPTVVPPPAPWFNMESDTAGPPEAGPRAADVYPWKVAAPQQHLPTSDTEEFDWHAYSSYAAAA